MKIPLMGAIRRRLLAVPILLKIMGIGLLVAGIFGSATLLQVGSTSGRVLRDLLEVDGLRMATVLSRSLEEAVARGDEAAMVGLLRRVQREDGRLRYAAVWDRDRRLLATTRSDPPPPQRIPELVLPDAGEEPLLRNVSTGQGPLLDLVLPIGTATTAWLQIGVDGGRAEEELRHLTTSILVVLIVCMLLGMGLALVLANAITRPVHELVRSAQTLSHGDPSVRTRIRTQDEIGTLGRAFNRMAASLEAQREELLAHARERLALIDRLVNATEEERKALAQELHDHLGQMLLAVLLEVQRLPVDEPEAVERRDALAGRISRLIDEVRLLAWGMRPSLLDDHGLHAALERYGREVARFAKLRIDVEAIGLEEGDPVPDRIAITCYRIAQEALSNTVRHAQASSASIVLILRRGTLTMLIEDDGIGFDVDSTPSASSGHLGLAGMRERAALVGGQCGFESSSDGTTVRVEIPMHREDRT